MISLRIHQSLASTIRDDLRRTHSVAAERVGFLFASSADESPSVAIGNHYAPLNDDDYLGDQGVGARFSGAALRSAMEHALSTMSSAFHVHVHEHRGRPFFSTVDVRSMLEFLPPFARLVPQRVHGAIVLSADESVAVAWSEPKNGLVPIEVSFIGFPLSIPWEARE